MFRFKFILPFCFLLILVSANGADTLTLLKPDRVFDGEKMQIGWWVAVKGSTIAYAGPSTAFQKANFPGTILVSVELKGQTLTPGFIEGHSHLFLHAYNEVPWKEQVLNESRAERTARAVNHALATLKAGFTTVRDLGTEGSWYDDVGLKTAIEKGVVPGPRMLVATRAITATGSYAPKSESADIDFPKGAAEADGIEGLTKEIRTEIGKGADVIKLYGDYRWGLNKDAMPTFTLEEMQAAVSVTASSGRKVVVHAVTIEAMKRAAMAGVSSIEHGDQGDEATFRLMKEKGVAYCPTLAATEAVAQYRGWEKGKGEVPAAVVEKKKSFAAALRSGVTICMGGDVGVYAHGTNAREMELMVEYSMQPIDVLKSATSVNADVFTIANKVGRIREGLLADIIVLQGNPEQDVLSLSKVTLVMKGGVVVK